MREIIQVGMKSQGEKVDMIRFADDIAILTESEEGKQNILMIINITFRMKPT